MNGKTPYEKFKESKLMVSSHVLLFPTLLLEGILRKVGAFYSMNNLDGKYVFTKYLQNNFFKDSGQKQRPL